MALDYVHDPKRGILTVRLTGPITCRNLDDFFGVVQGAGPIDPFTPTIWDMTLFDFDTACHSLFERLLAGRAATPGRRQVPIALVAPGDFGFGICRMHQIKAELLGLAPDCTVHVCRSTEEAETWLTHRIAQVPTRDLPLVAIGT